ncbi:MAG: glycosyltransferase [Clostridia bacterium]|nr:glycosyltransferase [Clostridia bacterium]
MLLSVVIPFYHVEKYIGSCLERAAQLPGEACEILLVDDCGHDGCAAIAADFCRAHANARVIRRAANGGLSAARNTGLDQAQGEYVYFLDSDDLPEPQALYRLARAAKENALDIAKARYVCFDDETGKETPGAAIEATQVMTGAALFASQCRADMYEPMVWQCVYRLAFLRENRLRMAEGLLFEDELFQAPALLCAQRAAAYEDVILRYRQREGSIMKSFARSSRWCASYLEVCRRLHALAGDTQDVPARRALSRRVGQIALSTVKNITAYGLPPEIACEATDFARRNQRELSGYAINSGDALVAAQGLLMRASLRAFSALYSRK